MRINLGCGDNRLPQPWINCDAEVDITKRLPWPDDSAEFIVIEHCVEHVTYYEAIEFFRGARRVLRIGGVLRVTVPSLTQVMNCRDQEYFDWLHAKGWAPTADDRGAMHAMLYCHGHKTAWNAMLMEATLYYAGFDSPRKQETLGWSSHPVLCGVEGHAKVIGDKFNRIESITFEVAKSTGDLAQDYDEKFFAMHQPWREEYDRMAETLVRELPAFETAVDFGCGNGYLFEALGRMGKAAFGIDGSRSVLKFNPSVLIVDITQPVHYSPRDLVICTEVAEHLPASAADTLVDNLCRAARHTIFFSAAQAGHGGHLHLNEQPRQYWIDKFETKDFEVDHDATGRIVAALRAANKKTWWFAQNCFVLRRKVPELWRTLPQNMVADQLIKSFTIDSTVSWSQLRRVAIVLGGSERVWDDLAAAELFCLQNKLEPEYYACNDMIEQCPGPIVACTLHPDKLRVWMPQRQNGKLPMPAQVWSHEGGSRADNPYVTHRLIDWGGSVGMFAYQVAREHGHDRVILCGVPMSNAPHFVRKTRWDAVSAFTRSWESRKAEMAPHVRSLSGGWTEELFGVPTPEWINDSREIAA